MYNYVELTQVTGNLEIKCIQVKLMENKDFHLFISFVKMSKNEKEI